LPERGLGRAGADGALAAAGARAGLFVDFADTDVRAAVLVAFVAGGRLGFLAGFDDRLVRAAALLATANLKSKSWCRNRRMRSRWDC
jgi:hypothetical protein